MSGRAPHTSSLSPPRCRARLRHRHLGLRRWLDPLALGSEHGPGKSPLPHARVDDFIYVPVQRGSPARETVAQISVRGAVRPLRSPACLHLRFRIIGIQSIAGLIPLAAKGHWICTISYQHSSTVSDTLNVVGKSHAPSCARNGSRDCCNVGALSAFQTGSLRRCGCSFLL